MKAYLSNAHVLSVILALSQASADGFQPHVTDLAFKVGTISASMFQVGAASEEKPGAAKAVVEEYWSAEPRGRYRLLAESYKLNLRRLGITDAAKYGVETQPPERIWGKRTYQKVDVSRDTRRNRDIAQIVLLVDWEQEGYHGVMTFIFVLTMEGDQWRISNIVN
jgi:hypothetical protein